MGFAQLEDEIRLAFDDVPSLPSWCLVNSREGEEPLLLEAAFREVPDWRSLDSSVLDGAPDGYGTALCFFSDEAFLYYLPAYLLADLGGELEQVDVVFHLVHGLDTQTGDQSVNPRRYGSRTWTDHAVHKFSMLGAGQVRAIVLYLEAKLASCESEMDRRSISEALDNYWRPRASADG